MGGGLIKERKGVSSVVAGLLIAQLLVAFFAFTVLVPRLLGGGTRESSSGQERELLRQKELLTPTVEEASENGIAVRVRNAGSVPSTVVGATYGFEGDLQTVPLQLTLAPGEEREVVLEPRSTEKVSLLTAYGNSFPVRAQLTVTGVIVSVVDQDTGEPVPGAETIVQLHSTYSEHRGITDNTGKFRAVNRNREGHTYGVLVTAPGYENRVVTGRVEGGKVVEVRVETRFDPLSLSLPSSLVSQPASLKIERQPFRASREVVAGYREENAASGWRWKEWAQTGAETENRSLGPEAGSWVPTGRTYDKRKVLDSLPSLPAGHRWVKTDSGILYETYREEKNEVEILKAQGWNVAPQYRVFTEYQADAYHWERIGSHKEYGPWMKSGTTTLATGLSGIPSGVVNGKEEMVSETEKRVWWVTSYQAQVPSGYVYSYTLYEKYYSSWRAVETGTETFSSYKGSSFTATNAFTWKKEYTYSRTVYTTGTRYSYGYDTYTRTARTVDDYGWVFRGRQTFSSYPTSGSGWDYRNVTSSTRQELTGYLATGTEPIYGWAERRSEHPPANGTVYWENGRTGTIKVRAAGPEIEYDMIPRSGPQQGWVTELQKVYEVVKTPVVRVENYTAYRVYEVPTSWSPVSATVALAPKNGYAGPVYLEASGGSLGASELRFSSPASTTLTVSPGSPGSYTATVRAYAVDLSGRRREVASGSLQAVAEGSAKLVGVENVLLSDNVRVETYVVGEEPAARQGLRTSEERGIEAVGKFDHKYYDTGIVGYPVVVVAFGGGTSIIGVIVEVSSWCDVTEYYFIERLMFQTSKVSPRTVIEERLWRNPIGMRPYADLDPAGKYPLSDKPERLEALLDKIRNTVWRELNLERLIQKVNSGEMTPQEAWKTISDGLERAKDRARDVVHGKNAKAIACMVTGYTQLLGEKEVGGTDWSRIEDYCEPALATIVKKWLEYNGCVV